jgi:hypothetical protein
LTSVTNGKQEADLREAVEKASILLKPAALGILCRKPLVDPDLPEVSDIDLLAIWDKPDEYVERLMVMGSSGRTFVDVLWIPAAAMLDPETAASYRMLPHLLMESDVVWMRSATVKTMIDRITLSIRDKTVWERRLGNLIGFGDAAFLESSRNLDFPPASLFFLQMASSYYMIALADCHEQSVMSLMNRPMVKLRNMAATCSCGLEELLISNLHLDVDPAGSLDALKKLHTTVNARCATRQLRGVNARTRGHYTYSISPLELEFRETVAAALIRNGDRPNANYYLRFWAYSLSRCPVVLEEADNGRKPSFYVPFRPLKESLQTACPEIIDDLALILGGNMTRAETEESIRGTADFRKLIVDQVEMRGFDLDARKNV